MLLQMWSPGQIRRGTLLICWPHTVPNAAQDTICPWPQWYTLLAHGQPNVHKDTQLLLYRVLPSRSAPNFYECRQIIQHRNPVNIVRSYA